MAIPSIAMIPSGYKDSKLYSVLPTDGTGDFTTTRASVATRVNENGLIEEVASNVPRLDYSDGGCPSLLLEGTSTNLITYSEDFSDASWTKSGSSVVSGFTSPDGSTNAFKFVPTNSNTTHRIKEALSVVSGDYTHSVFAKKGEYKNILVWDDELDSGIGVNLDDLSVWRNVNTQGYKIENYGNGWIRISVTFTFVSQTLTPSLYVYDNSVTPQITFSGNDVDSLYIWAAQLEENSYATSYIKTVGSPQTRTADTATGSGNSTVINSSEGVLYFEGSALADDGTNRYISLSDGSISNRVNIFFDSSNNLRGYYNGLSGSISINIDTTINNKIAFKYKSGDSALWVNGTEVATRADSLSLVGLNLLSFDLSGGGGNIFNSKTKSLQVYTTALSDAELISLTTI